MKKLYQLFSFALVAVMFASCNPSMKAFKKGNYYDATIKAVKQLRNNPDSKNALEVVQKSYPMALDYEKQRIKELTISNQPDKFFNISETYTRLNNLADEIARCPAALEVLKPVVYFHTQQKKAEELAWDEQYNAAQHLMDSGNYMDARLAAKRLEWIKEKNPNYKNLPEVLAEAYDLGTLKTLVKLKPELHKNYDINSYVFYDRLLDYLNKNIKRNFIQFYDTDLAKKIRLHPNEILSIQFLDFTIGQMTERESENEYESDSLSVGTYTDNDGNEHNAYGTVKATVYSNEQELPSKALMEITITDASTNEILATQKFQSEYRWTNRWVTFNGDKRAVPDNLLELTKRKHQVPPRPQELFLLLSDPIFNDATTYLRSYYRKK